MPSYFQSHEQGGYRAKVTVEWSPPDGKEPPPNWATMAEEIADDAMAKLGPVSYAIVQAMQGRTK